MKQCVENVKSVPDFFLIGQIMNMQMSFQTVPDWSAHGELDQLM